MDGEDKDKAFNCSQFRCPDVLLEHQNPSITEQWSIAESELTLFIYLTLQERVRSPAPDFTDFGE
jgi:hypothetical protein